MHTVKMVHLSADYENGACECRQQRLIMSVKTIKMEHLSADGKHGACECIQ